MFPATGLCVKSSTDTVKVKIGKSTTTAPMKRAGKPDAQAGHLMVGLMVLVAILTISSTVGFQAWQDVVRRDKEAEMIFRAQDICRAIKRFQKDQGTLPIELKQLMNKGNKQQFFLRRMYKDPLVKDGKWGLLFLAPGGIYDPNGEEAGIGVDASGNPLPAPASPLGPAGGVGTPGSSGATGLGRSRPGAVPLGGPPGGVPKPGEGGEVGLPIVGVKSLSKDPPFRVLRDQTDYSKWLFTALDQDLAPSGLILPGQNVIGGALPGGTGVPGGSNPRPPWPKPN